MKWLTHTGIVIVIILGVMFFSDKSQSFDTRDRLDNKNIITDVAVATTATNTLALSSSTKLVEWPEERARYKASHIYTPENVKGLYLSGWGAGNTTIRDRVVNMIVNSKDDLVNTKIVTSITGLESETLESRSGLNSVVIDVKDYTGLISFHLDQDMIDDNHKYDSGGMSIFEINNTSNKIANIKKLIEDLHVKNIYVIGRIAVFQDPYMPKYKPEISLRAAGGSPWKDKKGLTWVNPSSEEYWKYIVNLSKYSYDIGFDEINLDYIRYPTDGNIDALDLGLASGTTKYDIINNFYEYVGEELRDYVPVSADLFGLTTASNDDLGIGQKIESGLLNFDFVAPMIYPSHYGSGFKGIANPDASPYSTIRTTMIEAHKKVNALSSSTDQDGKVYWSKMRPWIQDFSLHTAYGINEVNAQIKALRELGINSYLIWNASNVYTRGVKY